MTYQYKTEPFSHQREIDEKTWDRVNYALFWEQGTGKTKAAIDTISRQYLAGMIDAVLILAPNTVHANWADEFEVHCPIPADDLHVFVYHSSKAKNKSAKWAMARAMDWTKLSIVCMTYEAFCTKEGKKFRDKFLTKRKAMFVCDESQRIKSPKTKRTKAVVAAGKKALTRRILTGTPITNSPFELYSQVRFLDPEFWKRMGYDLFSVFRARFGVYEKEWIRDREIPILKHYRNLDELAEIMKEIGSRVTKEEVLDLPPKLYKTVRFDLTTEQRKVYNSLRDLYIAEFEDGEEITAAMAIVRLLRLQQIASGYVPVDNDDSPVLRRIGDKNPRLDTLKEILEDLPHQAIIWARFHQDIDDVMELLGDRAVQYDGRITSPEARRDNLARFKYRDAQFFVANAAAGGTGLTLVEAKTVIYYTNSFNLEHRLQSEDRAHRIGQDQKVQYIDLAARNTVDTRIIQALRNKQTISAMVTGDAWKEWI